MMRSALLSAAAALWLSACATEAGSADAGASDCSAVDIENDPQNCGECGRTCVIPNAEAGCQLGECVIDRCSEGYADLDDEIVNGCEQEGALGGEVCNAADDDGDDECDEGLSGCRVATHRSFGNGHLYTVDLAAAQAAPFTLEYPSYFHLYQQPGQGLEQVYRCRKGDSRFFLTNSANCEGAGSVVETPGFWASSAICGAVPLFRTYSGASGNHFYTIDATERDNAVANLGYRDEGIAGYVWLSP